MPAKSPPPAEPSGKDARPWPVPIAPEDLAAALFRDADRKRDERLTGAANEPPPTD